MNKGREVERMEVQLEEIWEEGDPDGIALDFETDIDGVRSERLVYGVMLTFFSAAAVGIILVSHVLPYFAQRVTHAVYDSGEELEKDVMREAHSLVAQGEYEAAVEAFEKAAAEDPMNRLPWVEAAKIRREHLEDSAGAIETLRHALEGQEWGLDDAAFLLFRIAELYHEDMQDYDTAAQIMQQVIDDFPNTRHSANATHKLHQWKSESGDDELHNEEEEFLARQRAAEAKNDEPKPPNS